MRAVGTTVAFGGAVVTLIGVTTMVRARRKATACSAGDASCADVAARTNRVGLATFVLGALGTLAGAGLLVAGDA